MSRPGRAGALHHPTRQRPSTTTSATPTACTFGVASPWRRRLQRDERLPNVAIWLVNPPIGDPTHGSGILSFVYLMLISPLGRYLRRRGHPARAYEDRSARPSLRAHLRNVVRGPASGRRRLPLELRLPALPASAGRKAPGFFVPQRHQRLPVALPRRASSPSARASSSRAQIATPSACRGCARTCISARRTCRRPARPRCARPFAARAGAGPSSSSSRGRARRRFASELFGGFHQAGTTRMSALRRGRGRRRRPGGARVRRSVRRQQLDLSHLGPGELDVYDCCLCATASMPSAA